MRTRLPAALVLALAVCLAAPVANAAAARPVVTSVSPMETKVGATLKVRGRYFRHGANQNTVIFMSNRGPTVFVKAARATTTSLAVVLPPKLEQGMPRASDGGLRPNRFQIKVVANEPGASFTPRSKSPVIAPRSTDPPAPPDTDKDGQTDDVDTDDDNDFLTDAIEKDADVRTNPKNKDTDGDGREDGWEYYSAKDLNHEAVPYPTKRPYPNPLDPDPQEGSVDWDGDQLNSQEEHTLWKEGIIADPETATRLEDLFNETNGNPGEDGSVLGYSDGTQRSRPDQPDRTPNFVQPAGVYDPQWTDPYGDYPGFLEHPHDPDGEWTDDERDGDNDGLNNYHEEHGHMSARLWNAMLGSCDPEVKEWRDLREGQYYGEFDLVSYVQPKMLDADTDGDGLLDAEDDQDHDDVPNFAELDFRCSDGLGDATPTPNVNPFNPCAPHGSLWYPTRAPSPMSPTCPRYKPVSG